MLPNLNSQVARRRVFAPAVAIAIYASAIWAVAAASGYGWRTPQEMFEAIDPNLLGRGIYDALYDLSGAGSGLVRHAALYLPIGIFLGLSFGFGVRSAWLAVLMCLDVSVVEQALRWVRHGQTPGPMLLLLSVAGGLLGWRLGAVVPRASRPRTRAARIWLIVALTAVHMLAAGLAGLAAGAYVLGTLAMTPSQVGLFLQSHAGGRGELTGGAMDAVASSLQALDRMHVRNDIQLPAGIGADVKRHTERPGGPVRLVGSAEALRLAIQQANPGDIVELLPGRYLLERPIAVDRPGSAAAPIVLRAPALGSVVIESATAEALKVYAPFWIFENLEMRGICKDDTDCDHAFHVVAGARSAVFRNLLLADFNAHFKVNAEGGAVPDAGLIQHVTLIDTRPRQTPVPVTPIDVDAASGWRFSDNFIADFAKAGGDRISYGGYAKAAGSHNLFERNVVLCEWHLKALGGQTIGLSLGGGGSGQAIRRDRGRSGYEQTESIIRNNLIVACSDAGIYINRAPSSTVVHNTLLDTAGIYVRFPESSAVIGGNIVDGLMRANDGAVMVTTGNQASGIWTLYSGQHPLRDLFADPVSLDLRWQTPPPADIAADGATDLCGTVRVPGTLSRPGAFYDFAACSAGQ